MLVFRCIHPGNWKFDILNLKMEVLMILLFDLEIFMFHLLLFQQCMSQIRLGNGLDCLGGVAWIWGCQRTTHTCRFQLILTCRMFFFFRLAFSGEAWAFSGETWAFSGEAWEAFRGHIFPDGMDVLKLKASSLVQNIHLRWENRYIM